MEIKCKYCGKKFVIDNLKRKICDDCRSGKKKPTKAVRTLREPLPIENA